MLREIIEEMVRKEVERAVETAVQEAIKKAFEAEDFEFVIESDYHYVRYRPSPPLRNPYWGESFLARSYRASLAGILTKLIDGLKAVGGEVSTTRAQSAWWGIKAKEPASKNGRK